MDDLDKYEQLKQMNVVKNEDIKNFDTNSMISKMTKSMRYIGYNINRCCMSGLDNFAKLKVTTTGELLDYRSDLKGWIKTQTGSVKTREINIADFPGMLPWTTISFVEKDPVPAYVDAETRMGAVRFALRGNVPKDLAVHISENY